MLSESDKEELLTEVIEAHVRLLESVVALRRSMSAENRTQYLDAEAELRRVLGKVEIAGIPLEELKNTVDEEYLRPLLDQLQ